MAAINLIQFSYGTCLSSPVQISINFSNKQEQSIFSLRRSPQCKSLVKLSVYTFSETPRLTNPSKFPSPVPLSSQFREDCELYSFDIRSYSAVNEDDLRNFLGLSVSYSRVDVAQASHALFLKLFQDSTRLGNALISTYVKLSRLQDAYEAFLSVPFPDVVSYSTLMAGFAKSRFEHRTLELFCRMRSHSIEPNEYSFVAVLTACTRNFYVELGEQIHALIVKLGFMDHVFVGNALMCFYRECGFLHLVVQVFDYMSLRDAASWNTMLSSLIKENYFEASFELFKEMVASWSSSCTIDEITLATGLASCTATNALATAREIHARAIRMGFEGGLSVGNALIELYMKIGSLNEAMRTCDRMHTRDIITWTELIVGYMKFGMVDEAMEIFQKLPEKNCVSYNAMISGLCHNDQAIKALYLFVQMISEGGEVSDITLTCISNACGLLGEVKLSRQTHGFITKINYQQSEHIEAALIDMCTRCGRMKDAEKMVQAWSFEQGESLIQTSLLCGYARNGRPDAAISLFLHCFSKGSLTLDEILFSSVLGVCAELGIEKVGMQIHCLAIKNNFSSETGVGNSLVTMYSKCWNMKAAIQTFDSIPEHGIDSWNCLISGYVYHKQGDEAISVWSKMETSGTKPDSVTFSLVLSAYKYTNSTHLDQCCTFFHSMKKTYGVTPNSQHYTAFVSVLGFWGRLNQAEDIILNMPFEPDIAIWRALLVSCRFHKNISMSKRIVNRIISTEPRDSSSFVFLSNLYAASGFWQTSEMTRKSMKDEGFHKQPCRSWIFSGNMVHFFYVRDKSHPQAKDIYSGLNILIMECMKSGYQPDTSFVLHELEEYQKKDFLYYHSPKLAATYGILTTKPGETIHIMKNVVLCGDCHSFFKVLSAVTRRDIVVRDTSGFHRFSNGECCCGDHW